ncbi:hypothetical protein PG637_09995 [Riemerella anatipestifer]|nr:hypothetical protein [Riemerella anatipestifer]MDY3325997.1 hypothetical protein [Riemerella anatipestifer]MDY3352454.1 hypothetical protein [Riemerella anatipestifer]
MKKLLTLFFVLVLSACNGQQKNKKITQIPLEKQVTYRLDLTMKVPHEVYINDILIAQEFRNSNAGIDLNPYILKNGKYVVKLRLLPFSQYNEKLIRRKAIENTTLLFGTYTMDKESGKLIRSNVDKLLPITVPKTDVPYFEQEWEVEITELPYELEGWSNGQDLRKWDQKELEKKVVAYYKKLWEILNNGEGEKYMKLWQKADEELVIYNYENNYNDIYISEAEDIEKGCKNMMIPLEDYEMKIYAEGKIVTLERKTHTKEFNNYSPLDIKGWSPLIRKGKKAGGSSYGVKLYLPKSSDEFVIIRK